MITLYNNDCFEQLKTIDDNSVDLIIADPPYGISFNGVTSDTSWDNIKDYKVFITDFLIEVKRVLSDSGVCWLFCARTKIPEVFESIDVVGLHNNLKYWCTYARQKGRGSKNYPKSVAEEVLHVSKSTEFYYSNIEYLRDVVAPYVKDGKPRGWFVDINTGQRVRWTGLGNVLSFSAPYYKHKFEKQIHSTQKPFLLMCALITTSSKIGDTILDPFMGSGVTGVACDVLDRNFIGIEKDKEMFDKASNWINNYSKPLASEYINNRFNYPNKVDLWGEI